MIWAMFSAIGIIPLLVILWGIGSVCDECCKSEPSDEPELYI